MSPLHICLIVLVGLFSASSAQNTFSLFTSSQNSTNVVNVLSGNNNGNVSVSNNYATDGGASIFVAGPAVQSQGAVIVDGNRLFVVSPATSTVSYYTIDDATKSNTLTKVGASVSTNGDWPNSLTAYQNFLCVLNAGKNNGFQCFNVTSTGLVAIPGASRTFGLDLTTPPAPGTSPSQISFTPDRKGIVVSFKGGVQPIRLWTFDPTTLTLAAQPAVSPDSGRVGFGFTFDFSDPNTLVLTDTSPLNTTGGVRFVTLSTAGAGSVTFNGDWILFPSNGTCWIEQSPTSKRFYATNAGSSTLTQFVRTGTNGLTVQGNYDVPNAAGPIDLVVVNLAGKDFVYVLGNARQSVYVYAIDSTTGVATLNQRVPTGNGRFGVGLAYFVSPSSTSAPSIRPSTGSAYQYAPLVAMIVFLALFI